MGRKLPCAPADRKRRREKRKKKVKEKKKLVDKLEQIKGELLSLSLFLRRENKKKKKKGARS